MAIEPLDDTFDRALVIEQFLAAAACGCGDAGKHHDERDCKPPTTDIDIQVVVDRVIAAYLARRAAELKELGGYVQHGGRCAKEMNELMAALDGLVNAVMAKEAETPRVVLADGPAKQEPSRLVIPIGL